MKRTGQLRRNTPLKSSSDLRRTTPLRTKAPLVSRSPLPVMSVKRRAANRVRAKVVAAMKAENHICAMCGRTDLPLDAHELLSRARRGSITDPTNIILLCRANHDRVTRNPAWAEANGWAKPSQYGGPS